MTPNRKTTIYLRGWFVIGLERNGLLFLGAAI